MSTDYFYAYGIKIGGRTLEEWLRELPAGTYAAYLETDTTVKDFPVTLKPGVHIAVTVLDEIRQTGTTAAAVITVPSAAASDGKAHIVLADITPAAIAYTETGAGGGGSDIEIVNDLTTGGADKALSAEMGKQLESDKIDINGNNASEGAATNLIKKAGVAVANYKIGDSTPLLINAMPKGPLLEPYDKLWCSITFAKVWDYIKSKTDAEYVGSAVNNIADWNFDPSTIDNGNNGIYAIESNAIAANKPENIGIPLIGAMISYGYSADDRRRVLFAMSCGGGSRCKMFIRKYYTSWSDWVRLSSIDDLNTDYNTLDQKIDSAVIELEKQDTALGGEIAKIETDLQGKQETLVSGTNIKTVNGSPVLGAGDIETADTKVTAITLTTDSAGAVTGGTATLSDGTQVQITVTQQTA